jgi:transcriptional regulatory protein LevR
MVERLMKNICLTHNKVKSVLKKYEDNYLDLKNNFVILEETYGIRIPDEEYAYILELLNDEK